MPRPIKTKPRKPRYTIYVGDAGVYVLDDKRMDVGDPVIKVFKFRRGPKCQCDRRDAIQQAGIIAARRNREHWEQQDADAKAKEEAEEARQRELRE